MARKRRDPLEQAIEEALAPGVFIGYRDNWGFVEGVEAVKAKLTPLIEKGEAARAVALLETFIAGSYEKSEEIDDSSASFGMFVRELFCGWIRARQAAKADPDGTAGMLLSWMEDDDYGYCHDIEKDAVKVFDRPGLAAFERAVQGRLGGAEKGSYGQRRKVEILKAIHVKRRAVDAYVALCDAEGELAPADCEALAEMCLRRRKPQDALAWVERGLELEKKGPWPNRGGWRLPDMRREILKKLGRGEDALAAAWEDYREAPSVYAYDDLMKYVPKGQRSEWHARALAALDDAGLSPRIDILVKTKEGDRLAGVIDGASRTALMALSHYTTEPAARKLAKSHPLLAAKLHTALGLRILEAKKSKYYGAALGHFETIRKILLQEGRNEEWDEIVVEIRDNHRRKSGFMPGFERLVEGRPSKSEPSFLDRARKKWQRHTGNRKSLT